MKKRRKSLIYLGLLSMFVVAGCAKSGIEKDLINQESMPQVDRQEFDETELKNDDPEIFSEDIASQVEKEKAGTEILSLNDKWNQYINYEQGYKINIPKLNSGKNQIEIEKDGEVVFIYDVEYEKMSKSVEDARLKVGKYEKLKGGPSYAILVEDNIKDKDDLERFIRQRFDLRCKLGNIKNTNQEGIDYVEIDGTDFDPNTGEGCFINYRYTIFYSQEYDRVATWNEGQDASFVDEKGKSLHAEINNSFEFIE